MAAYLAYPQFQPTTTTQPHHHHQAHTTPAYHATTSAMSTPRQTSRITSPQHQQQSLPSAFPSFANHQPASFYQPPPTTTALYAAHQLPTAYPASQHHQHQQMMAMSQSQRSHASHPWAADGHHATISPSATAQSASSSSSAPSVAGAHKRLQFSLPVEQVSSATSSSVYAELVLSLSQTGSDHGRTVHLRLENPRDPAFLFHCAVDSSLFGQLVSAQQLNGAVTFESLAGELEKHLRKVQDGHARSLARQIQENEYVMVCQWRVQANEFGVHPLGLLMRSQHAVLPFWTLPFKPATDAQVKQFMMDAWTGERDQREQLQAQVTLMHGQLQELSETNAEYRHRATQLTADQEATMQQEKLKWEREMLDLSKRYADDQTQATLEHKAEVAKLQRDLTAKFDQLDAMHQKLQQEYTALQADKGMAQGKLEALTFEHDHLVQEAAALRKEKEQLRQEVHTQQDQAQLKAHEYAQLQRRADQLESDLHANGRLLTVVQEGGSKDSQAREVLSEALATLKRQHEHLQAKHDATLGEFARGQETMGKLQARLKEVKATLDRKREALHQSEKLVEAKELAERDHAHAMSDLRRDLQQVEGEKARLEGELLRAQRQVKECEDQLAQRVKMFEALSNERTAQQIGGLTALGGGAAAAATTTHAYQPFTSSLHHNHHHLLTSPIAGAGASSSAFTSHLGGVGGAPLSFLSNLSARGCGDTSAVGLMTPMQAPAPAQRPTGSLDFDSPSPGAAVTTTAHHQQQQQQHQQQMARVGGVKVLPTGSDRAGGSSAVRTGGVTESYAQNLGISSTARQYLGAKNLAQNQHQQHQPTTFVLPTQRSAHHTATTTTNDTSKENQAMHTEVLFSPAQTNSTTGAHHHHHQQQQQQSTRQPLGQLSSNTRANQQATTMHGQLQKHQPMVADPLRDYAPVNVH